jgi:hypothetical protein
VEKEKKELITQKPQITRDIAALRAMPKMTDEGKVLTLAPLSSGNRENGVQPRNRHASLTFLPYLRMSPETQTLSVSSAIFTFARTVVDVSRTCAGYRWGISCNHTTLFFGIFLSTNERCCGDAKYDWNGPPLGGITHCGKVRVEPFMFELALILELSE